jgi:hypothetical protein
LDVKEEPFTPQVQMKVSVSTTVPFFRMTFPGSAPLMALLSMISQPIFFR